jgi:hypothetical protein
MGLTNVREKPRMGRATIRKVLARLIEAEGSVHGQADIRGVRVLLAIVLPPAHRAQPERIRRFQRLVPAT